MPTFPRAPDAPAPLGRREGVFAHLLPANCTLLCGVGGGGEAAEVTLSGNRALLPPFFKGEVPLLPEMTTGRTPFLGPGDGGGGAPATLAGAPDFSAPLRPRERALVSQAAAIRAPLLRGAVFCCVLRGSRGGERNPCSCAGPASRPILRARSPLVRGEIASRLLATTPDAPSTCGPICCRQARHACRPLFRAASPLIRRECVPRRVGAALEAFPASRALRPRRAGLAS